jgi:hypothetical protein
MISMFMMMLMIRVIVMAMLIDLSTKTPIAQHHHRPEQKHTEDFAPINIHQILT